MDDPREILKAAGVECAEVDAWAEQVFTGEFSEMKTAPEAQAIVGPLREVVVTSNVAILALARLVASLCRCGNCEHHQNEYDYEDWWVWCTIHGEPGFVPEKGRESYMPERVEYVDECHFAKSRWACGVCRS